jgi:hypothetical protein
MPFDGHDLVRARLDILRDICERTTPLDQYQHDWRRCLWSEARRDPRLRELRLPYFRTCRLENPNKCRAVAAFFGLTMDEAEAVFDARSKASKLVVIHGALARPCKSMSKREIDEICTRAAATAREIAPRLPPIPAHA